MLQPRPCDSQLNIWENLAQFKRAACLTRSWWHVECSQDQRNPQPITDKTIAINTCCYFLYYNLSQLFFHRVVDKIRSDNSSKWLRTVKNTYLLKISCYYYHLHHLRELQWLPTLTAKFFWNIKYRHDLLMFANLIRNLVQSPFSMICKHPSS